MNCIKCGKETEDFPFHVLQVQTLHVRDLSGEKRVQALGGFEDYCVCSCCAEEKYHQLTDNSGALLKAALPYGLLLIPGTALTAFFLHGNGAFRLLGLGMLVCAILGLYSVLRSTRVKRKELLALGREKATERCAWDCLTESAPKKNDINDITYIPVNGETLARKNGDLMILYDLLPEIAIEAHKRIHGIHETDLDIAEE